MKRTDELGISRRPWELIDDGLTVVTKFDEDVYGVVAECRESADARLIAAAPEMYRALYNLVKLHEDCSNNECDDCPRGIGNGRKCDVEEDDILELAYHAIAKAACEEVAK